MSSRRVLKAAEAIREVVSMAILTELRDPRIQHVTVTYVEVSGDMRNAKVHVSVMGDEAMQALTLHGLENSRGFLQKKINERIETRYTPKLRFELDKGIQNSLEVTRILNEVLPKSKDEIPESDDDDTDDLLADDLESDQPESDQPESDQPESDQPESDQPESDQPESDEPKSDALESGEG
jgi:ribosome-binding factor A